MLGAYTLASLRTLGRSWGSWGEHRDGHFGIQASILWIWGEPRVPILKVVCVFWIKKGVFVHACFQVSFSDDFLGLKLDVWDLKKQAFGMRCTAKINFRTSWDFQDLRVHFS